jgi:hypothetical protein
VNLAHEPSEIEFSIEQCLSASSRAMSALAVEEGSCHVGDTNLQMNLTRGELAAELARTNAYVVVRLLRSFYLSA